MEKLNEDVLWKNEVRSNKLLTITLIGLAVMIAIISILVSLDIFYVYRWNSLVINIILLLVECSLIGAIIYSRRHNYENKHFKIILMGLVILSLAVLNMIFTFNAVMMIVIPIILSARYFSKEYTIKVSIATIVVFFISTILGALYGNYDVNSLQLPPHTIIDMGEEVFIADAIESGALEFDPGLMVLNVLLYSFIPTLFPTVICILISVMIADHGRLMVYEQKELAENSARVETELALANKIQADMLPNLFPVFPERTEFDIYATMTPAKEVGGDFYDFFMIDDDHLGLVIADVSGKGIPAAMFMMMSKNIIANNALLGKSPAKALTDTNAAVCENNHEGMFVTVWLGVLEISTGILTAANAGHEFPILKKYNGVFELFKDKHGLPVGSMEGVRYKEYQLQLEPGDKLFVYTDGVAEATDSNEDMFGTKRTILALNSEPDAGPVKMLQNVRAAVDEFVKNAEQFDDLTMLGFEYKGLN